MVAANLWGPASINFDYGFNYYISFVDAWSRFTWIYFLKSKAETWNVVIQFISQAKNQTGNPLKIMQIDGGTEFKPLKEYFIKKGIVHITTCPHTSEQNGLVERKHIHIIEIGFTLIPQASLPIKFWLDAFSTTLHLINRLPTKEL